MKNNMMKKLLTMTLACAMTLSLAACGSKAESSADSSADQNTAAPTETDTKAYKVAIIKQLDHASLDEIANAVTAELDQISADKNVKIEYEVTSGQGDQTILKQLSDQAIADGVDAIIPIATTAAQIAALSAEETKTPVVYAAVSDPETAKLTGIDYVTGTSDALNTNFIMDMMFAQNPNTAKVGLLYSLSEPNSAKPIADAKAYLDTKGIEYVEQTANTNDEVVAAASALIAAGVDAVFTPTDNVIMAAELAIYEDLAKNGIPHYTGADSFVRNGAYATCGVNYTDRHDRGHGWHGGLLPDGRRHHPRQHRHLCPHRQAGRLRLLRQHGRGGRGHHHQGLIQSNSPPRSPGLLPGAAA